MTEKDKNILDPWTSILDDLQFSDEDDNQDDTESRVKDNKNASTQEDEDDMFDLDFEDNENDDEDNEDSSDNDSVFAEIAKNLKSKAVIDIDDEELKSIKTEEDFDSLIEKTVEEKLQKEISYWFENTFDDKTRELVLQLSKGGNLEDLLLQQKAAFDLTNEKEQEAAVRLWLKESGMDNEEIEDNIQLYKDSDTLEAKSKTAVIKLEKIREKREKELEQKRQLEEQEKEKEKAEIIDNIKEKIKTADEIKGFPITDKDRNELLTYIMVPSVKYKDPVTNKIINITKYQADEIERSKDMEVFLLKALQSMKGYDLTPIEKKGITKNTKIIEEKYKKMIESDSQSKFKQTNHKQLKKDPFEEYLKKIK